MIYFFRSVYIFLDCHATKIMKYLIFTGSFGESAFAILTGNPDGAMHYGMCK